MAANYWLSSHANNHILTRHDLRTSPGRAIDLKFASEREIACVNIWSCNGCTLYLSLAPDSNADEKVSLHLDRYLVIHKLAKRLNCRQIVTATAVTYFRRFYVKNAIADTDPCLVASACMYVATKVEEAPCHIKTVVEAARFVFAEYPALGAFPTDAAVLAEMEFYLIEDLDFHLIIWHPYRDLAHFTGREDSAVPKDASEKLSEWVPAAGSNFYDEYRRECDRQASMLDLSDEALQMAWFIINDTYRTDIILLYPPYIIALASIYITVVLQPHPSLRAIKQLPPPVHLTSTNTSNNTSNESSAANSIRKQSLPPSQQTVNPLDFFAHFPLSMSLVLELVQEIVASYELWNRLENPLLPIQRPPDNPADLPSGLASTRLNQPYNNSTNARPIHESSESSPASKAAGLMAAAKTGDKAADERVVEVLVRMRKEREADLG